MRLVEYAADEIMLNVRQHAQGRGFASAQYYPKSDFVRIGVADNGIGILESFRRLASPHYREGMSCLEALRKAIQPEVSSVTHLPPPPYGQHSNFGVGLSMLLEMAKDTLGHTVLISGDGYWKRDGTLEPNYGQIPEGKFYRGTICSIAFKRSEIEGRDELAKKARIALGLQSDTDDSSFFTS